MINQPDDFEHQRMFEMSSRVIQKNGQSMMMALSSNDFTNGVKFASIMVNELSTTYFQSKVYYELYSLVVEYLRQLELCLSEGINKKVIYKLYEVVQYLKGLIQRLYLLITVGVVCIKLKNSSTKYILGDLEQMCRAVHAPIHGMFLRSYLCEMTNENFPKSEFEKNFFMNYLDFYLNNFSEMNKLWVRMKHLSNSTDHKFIEQERKQFGVLVGKSLSRISCIDDLDDEIYCKVVFPKITDQIMVCRDVISQQVLFDVLIQTTSNEWHLKTLQPLFKVILSLEPEVNITSISTLLINRIYTYMKEPEVKNSNMDVASVFSTFFKYIPRIIESRTSLKVHEDITILIALEEFTLNCYDVSIELTDVVFSIAYNQIKKLDPSEYSKDLVNLIFKLLIIPLNYYKDINILLEIENYVSVLKFLKKNDRRYIAVEMCGIIKDYVRTLGSIKIVESLFSILSCLVCSADELGKYDYEDLVYEQNLLISIFHLIHNSDPIIYLELISKTKEIFDQKDSCDMEFLIRAYPALIYSCLRFIKNSIVHDEALRDQNCDSIFKILMFIRSLIEFLEINDKNTLSVISLHLQVALTASSCHENLTELVISSFEKAFTLYDENLSSDNERSKAWYIMTSSLCVAYQSITKRNIDDWNSFCTISSYNVNGFNKMARKVELSIELSKLYWLPEMPGSNYKRNQNAVLNHLSKIEDKVSNLTLDNNLMYLTILLNDAYIYYLELMDPDLITPKINQLISIIKENSKKNMNNDQTPPYQIVFQNILNFIQHQKEKKENMYLNIVN